MRIPSWCRGTTETLPPPHPPADGVDRCRSEEPELKPTTGAIIVACHLHDSLRQVQAAG
jgi:hypothetical protein